MSARFVSRAIALHRRRSPPLGEADDTHHLLIDETRRVDANIGVRPQLERANDREALDTATLAPGSGVCCKRLRNARVNASCEP